MVNDSLGDRMKEYENAYRPYLTKRTPVIIRIDGKAFHSYTRHFKRPYDMTFKHCMWNTALQLCKNIMNAKMAFVQSDEISILMVDFNRIYTDAWFGNGLNKIVSISAAMATLYFNRLVAETEYKDNKYDAMFDSRAFNVPVNDVANYFVRRQNDVERNSIEMAGRTYFSHKQLNNVNCKQIKEKLLAEHNVNWEDYPAFFRRGICIVSNKVEQENSIKKKTVWSIDNNIPLFKEDRNYIERYLNIED